MRRNKIPAETPCVKSWRLVSDGPNLFVWCRWDDCEDDKLMLWCREEDFRKIAKTYLWNWFVQDVVKATWWRIFRRG